jgi:trigger factor
MNITRENTGDYTASLFIEIAPEDFMSKVNESIEKLRKKANIPGFRPGKAPLGLVKRHYGKTTILEEVNQMAFENIYKYVEDEKLKIIGRPLVNIEKTPQIDDLTEDISYTFVFDIGLLPEFDVVIAKEKEIEYKKVVVTDEALEKEIDALRKRNASFGKSDIVTEECMVTGTMTIDDPSEEKTEEDSKGVYRYFYIDKLNENPKLQKLFMGAKTEDILKIEPAMIEDRKALEFLIPASVDISKKGIEMTFVPNEMYTSTPAELNEEFFAKSFPGQEIETEEDFRKMLREELDRHFARQCDDIFLFSVRKKLIEDTELPLPADFVKRFLIENSKEENEEKLSDLDERFDDYLEAIKWEFIQDRIFEKFEIKIGIEDFKNYIRDFYREYMKKDDIADDQIDTELKQLMQDKKRMDGIEDSIRRSKSLELFKNNFTIVEKKFASFEEMAEADKNIAEKPKKATKKKAEKEEK